MASVRQPSSRPPSPLSSPARYASTVDQSGPAGPFRTSQSRPPSPIDIQAPATAQAAAGAEQPASGQAQKNGSITNTNTSRGLTLPTSSEPPLLVVPVPGPGKVNGDAGAHNSADRTAQTGSSKIVDDQAPKIRRGFFGLVYAWLYESTACLFAVLMVIIEIVLLAVYNGKSTDDWTHTWSINSVFAFLTTLLEAAIAFAVTSCLGQLRWLWFQNGNQELRWMDRLTNARQPSGALHFVVSKGAWRHWAVLGALLIVALLGTSVFIQEVIVSREETLTHYPSEKMCRTPISNDYKDKWQTGVCPGAELPFTEMVQNSREDMLML